MPVSAKGIRAARAFVELYVEDKLPAGLSKAQRRLRNFGASLIKQGVFLSGAVGGTFGLLGASGIRAAAEAEEILNKFNQTFGDSAAEAGRFADDLAARIGRSGTKVRESLAEYQAFFVGLGFGAGEARKLAQEVQELSLDFASFNNLLDAEGQRRFISALAGSSEVLDRFGINTKEAALQQELIRLGLARTVRAATEQQKVAARLSIIWRAMTGQGAVGDAERTQGSFQNSVKRLNGELFELRRAIGEALLPAATRFARFITGIVTVVRKWVNENPRLARTLFLVAGGVGLLGIALVGLGLGFALLGVAAGGFAAAATVVAVAAKVALGGLLALGTVTGALAASIVFAVALFGSAFLVWLGEATTFYQSVARLFTRLSKFVVKSLGGMADAISSGNLALAGDILWNTLNVAWLTGVKGIRETWGVVVTSMLLTFQSFSAAVLKVWSRMWAGVATLQQSAISGVTKFFNNVKFQVGFLSKQERDDLNAFEDKTLEEQRNKIAAEATARVNAIKLDKEKGDEDALANQELNFKQRELELVEAKKKLDKLIEKGKEEQKKNEEEDFTIAESRGGIIEALKDLLSGASAGARGAESRVSSTFNSFEARRLQNTGSLAVRQLAAAERTERNTREVARETRGLRNAVSFS